MVALKTTNMTNELLIYALGIFLGTGFGISVERTFSRRKKPEYYGETQRWQDQYDNMIELKRGDLVSPEQLAEMDAHIKSKST